MLRVSVCTRVHARVSVNLSGRPVERAVLDIPTHLHQQQNRALHQEVVSLPVSLETVAEVTGDRLTHQQE